MTLTFNFVFPGNLVVTEEKGDRVSSERCPRARDTHRRRQAGAPRGLWIRAEGRVKLVPCCPLSGLC